MLVRVILSLLALNVLASSEPEPEKTGLSKMFAPILFPPTANIHEQHDGPISAENLDYYDAVAAGLDGEPRAPIVRPAAVFQPPALVVPAFRPIQAPVFEDIPPMKVSQKDFETKKLANFALFNQGTDGFQVKTQEVPVTTGSPKMVQVAAGTEESEVEIKELETTTPEIGLPPIAEKFVVSSD
ncbi:unnamed protein product [Bursaphelenchus xylophilus]|uniref:(pine wood nematode) hypothetical protein n=1 Tax=Bursaphelenchus xylophilus TaxID=6326 RepID=A0A1I7RP93_BURXY|nr:unnamed protein product [Bursaphelenchus xylophilus]CAG9095623.1 unnamed protein product [Bursaphelenchus xylophilus]